MSKLTVPNIMVAAVAAIGLYAGYRLVKNKVQDVKPAGSGEGELVLLGDPLKMTLNRYYGSRINAGGPTSFIDNANSAEIKKALEALGFYDVKVFMNESELPSGWPSSTRKNVTAGTRWFIGQWRAPSMTVPRPADMEAIWITKPPPNATYTASPAVSGLPCPPGSDCGGKCKDCDKSYVVNPDIHWGGPGYFNSSYANEWSE
jgi:hypothetical protein